MNQVWKMDTFRHMFGRTFLVGQTLNTQYDTQYFFVVVHDENVAADFFCKRSAGQDETVRKYEQRAATAVKMYLKLSCHFHHITTIASLGLLCKRNV